MPLIDIYQEKWARKTLAAVEKWTRKVSESETFQSYVAGIAAVTGLSDSEVAASLPARNYREFQSKASQFAGKFEEKVKRAAAMRKWAKNYVDAFRAR